jgi:cytochrome P450
MYKGSAHLVPFIKQRMLDLDNAEKTGGSKEEFKDFTTWHIGGMADYPDAAERTPQRIASRLMLVNFAAIHTSTFTATNVLFDIFSSPQADSIVAELREEIEQTLAVSDGKWDKNAVARLFKTDSAIRESLRVSTFMSHGMDRLVVDPKGVTMTDGLHLPQGTRISTSTYSIHHDNDIYPNANTYDAFRFSRAREESLASIEEAEILNELGEKDFSKVLESKNLSIVTTSETFLPFGHGRHACPGRFFAATEIKLLLAYILMNYDVKPMETRPPNVFMGGSILPPMKATICVKRRKL